MHWTLAAMVRRSLIISNTKWGSVVFGTGVSGGVNTRGKIKNNKSDTECRMDFPEGE